MRRATEPKPIKRDGIWYLIRRVPKEFSELDTRVLVKASTFIAVADDPRAVRAKVAVRQLNGELEAYWVGLRDGKSIEAKLRYKAAQARAKSMGLHYQPAEDLSQGSLDEIMKRISLLVDTKALDSETEVAAAMGGEEHPKLKLSDLVEEIEAVQEIALASKSPNQIKRWRAAKQRAVANFVEAIGDNRALVDLNRSDALAFRNWWQERILRIGLSVGTANKEFGHISGMLKTIEDTYQLGISDIFTKLNIKGKKAGQRKAFSPTHVQDVILATGALDALNDQARCVLYVMAETGLRLSEACCLLPETIHLDAPIPYVDILPIDRELKTDPSERKIPLVGVALMALQAHPNGFSRYWDKGDTLSATVNKFLRGNHMSVEPKQTAYSLRHTFEDRLTAVEAPEKVVAMLMGHAWHRELYGDGPTLEQKQHWLNKICFKPPKHV